MTISAKGKGGGGGGGRGKPAPEPETPSYGFEFVYVLGDSLVDSGNALKLAEFYDDLPFQSLPEGAPTTELGYFDGRFSDGFTYVDLLANKYVGQPTEEVFPFGYKYEGIPIAPFASDPDGVSLNFAYGGAQIIQGNEAVSDLDNQTDALRDAVDKNFDPNALVLVTIGGNDIRELAPAGSDPADFASAIIDINKSLNEMYHELLEIVEEGAVNLMITGIPDVGIIPRYDINHNGVLDGDEIARAAAATEYSAIMNQALEEQLIPLLEEAGANITFVNLSSFGPEDTTQRVIAPTEGVLDLVIPILEQLNDLPPGTISSDILQYQELIFFDEVHPTAQVHALVASYIHSQITGAPYVEILPMDPVDVVFAQAGSIATVGEVDSITVSLTKGVTYTIDVLGVASLGIGTALGDPALTITDFRGKAVGGFDPLSGNDNGLGFDAHFVFTPEKSGDYTIHIWAEGSLTGSYVLQVGVVATATTSTALSANDNLRTSDQSVAMISAAAAGMVAETVVTDDAAAVANWQPFAAQAWPLALSDDPLPGESVTVDHYDGGELQSFMIKAVAQAHAEIGPNHQADAPVQLATSLEGESQTVTVHELAAKSGLFADATWHAGSEGSEQMQAALALAAFAQQAAEAEGVDPAQVAEALGDLVDTAAVDAIVGAFAEGEIASTTGEAFADLVDILDLPVQTQAGPIMLAPQVDLLAVDADAAGA